MNGLLTQCAAVTTHEPLTSVPPQKWVEKGPTAIWSEICHGSCPTFRESAQRTLH